MKKKFRFIREEEIESYSHMEFIAYILIDDRIVNFESITFYKLDVATDKCIELLKSKYNNMYQDLLNYREKYKLETLSVSLEYKTLHIMNNLPF